MSNTTYPTLDEVDGAILSDYVYHLTDSATQVPAGWIPLETGANHQQLAYYDQTSGVYAEAYEKTAGATDANGNDIPTEIMVVYRGTVDTSNVNNFAKTTPGYNPKAALLVTTSQQDHTNTWANNFAVLTGQLGTNVPAVESADDSFRKSVNSEFGNNDGYNISWIDVGQSQGGNDAEIAVADAIKNEGATNTQAWAFNSLPLGPELAAGNLQPTSAVTSAITNFYASNEILTDSWVGRGLFGFLSEALDFFDGTGLSTFDVGSSVELTGPDVNWWGILTQGKAAITDAHDPKSALAGLLSEVQSAGQTADTTPVSYSTVLQETENAYQGVASYLTPQLDPYFGTTGTPTTDYTGAYIFISETQANLNNLLSENAGADLSSSQKVTLETDLAAMVNGYHVVQTNDTWSTVASAYNVSTTTLQALNTYFVSPGSATAPAQIVFNQSLFGPNAILRVPMGQIMVGLPTTSQLASLLPNQVLIYNLTTDRTYLTDALVDGSDAGNFIVVDNGGNTLFEAPASQVHSHAWGSASQYTLAYNGNGVLTVTDIHAARENG